MTWPGGGAGPGLGPGTRPHSGVPRSPQHKSSVTSLGPRAPGAGDMCAAHRGSSPSPASSPLTQRRSRTPRRSPSSTVPVSPGPRTPRPSVEARQRTRRKVSGRGSSKVEAGEEQRFRRLPSSRSKKLYRFTRTFSDGFSESDPEDWFSKTKRSKDVESNKKKISKHTQEKIKAFAKFLRSPKNSQTVPEVVVQDFSLNLDHQNKVIPKINKAKLKALTAFLEKQSGNSVVEISEVSSNVLAKNSNLKTKLSAVAQFNSNRSRKNSINVFTDDEEDIRANVKKKANIKTKLSAVSQFNANISRKSSVSDKREDVMNTNDRRKLNKSKLMAVTSFSKLGKKEVKYVELEADPDDQNGTASKSSDEAGNKGLKLNRSKIIALTTFSKHGKKDVQYVEVESEPDETEAEEKKTTDIKVEDHEDVRSKDPVKQEVTSDKPPEVSVKVPPLDPIVSSKPQTQMPAEDDVAKPSKDLGPVGTPSNTEGGGAREEMVKTKVEQIIDTKVWKVHLSVDRHKYLTYNTNSCKFIPITSIYLFMF